MAPDPDDAPADWYPKVLTRAIISALTGKHIGRSLHKEDDFTLTQHSSYLDQMTTYVHVNPATGGVSVERPLPRPEPGPGEEPFGDPYALDAHAEPGGVTVPMEGAGASG